MDCNCSNICNNDETTIEFITGTSFSATVSFDTDISSYSNAVFSIRKNYELEPVINKTIAISETTSLNINLDPNETLLFNQLFPNGKNSMTYIWGLNLIDSNSNVIVNVFPQTGQPAPLCIVYNNVVEGN